MTYPETPVGAYDALASDPPEDCEREGIMARVMRGRLSPVWLLECEHVALDAGWQPDPRAFPVSEPAPASRWHGSYVSDRWKLPTSRPFATLDRRTPPPAPAPAPAPDANGSRLERYRQRRAEREARRAARAEAQRRAQLAKRRRPDYATFPAWTTI